MWNLVIQSSVSRQQADDYHTKCMMPTQQIVPHTIYITSHCPQVHCSIPGFEFMTGPKKSSTILVQHIRNIMLPPSEILEQQQEVYVCVVYSTPVLSCSFICWFSLRTQIVTVAKIFDQNLWRNRFPPSASHLMIICGKNACRSLWSEHFLTKWVTQQHSLSEQAVIFYLGSKCC